MKTILILIVFLVALKAYYRRHSHIRWDETRPVKVLNAALVGVGFSLGFRMLYSKHTDDLIAIYFMVVIVFMEALISWIHCRKIQ